MDIRGKRTWCPTCTAPLVFMENVPVVQTFLACLPAWRAGEGATWEGFDRAQVAAVISLREEPDPKRIWDGVYTLELEYTGIRMRERKANA